MSYHKKQKVSKKQKEQKEHKVKKEQKKCSSNCNCELKYYFPLPNIPTQPVGGSRVKPDAWLSPGSVEACCSICSTVKPVYANPCNTCRYDKGVYPINNSAYFTSGIYM